MRLGAAESCLEPSTFALIAFDSIDVGSRTCLAVSSLSLSKDFPKLSQGRAVCCRRVKTYRVLGM